MFFGALTVIGLNIALFFIN